MKISEKNLRKLIKEEIELALISENNSFEEQIEELRDEIEYFSVESFTNFKFDDDDTTFSTIELQALARNIMAEKTGNENALPSKVVIDEVKEELLRYGLTFTKRQVEKSVRGMTSNSHGTHPFAGQGSGGSGFSNLGLGLGGGPGSIGGGRGKPWSASQKGSLSMGSKRR